MTGTSKSAKKMNGRSGTAVIYAAKSRKKWIPREGDFALDLRMQTFPEEVRAHLNHVNQTPKRKQAVANEIFVVFGPLVAKRDAVKSLRKLIAKIKRDGLFIGHDEGGKRQVEP